MTSKGFRSVPLQPAIPFPTQQLLRRIHLERNLYCLPSQSHSQHSLWVSSFGEGQQPENILRASFVTVLSAVIHLRAVITR